MKKQNLDQKATITWEDPDSLIPYQRNTKAHSTDQIGAVAKSFVDSGMVQPIVIDSERVIIVGHCRREAAIQLGMKKVPVILADWLTKTEARKLRIADNRSNEAPWSLDFLRFELGGLDAEGVDLRDVGFPKDQIGDFLETGFMPDSAFEPRTLGTEFAEGKGGGGEGEDEAPKPPKDPKTKRGELWILGNHRLLCGDSTNAEDVERLISGNKVELCFTSPPYSDMRDYGGCDLSEEKLSVFLSAPCEYFAVNLGIKRTHGEIVRYWEQYIAAAENYSLKLLSWNVWDKLECGSVGNQTAMFGIQHEWIFVFGKEPKKLNRTVFNQSRGERANYTRNRGKDGVVRGGWDGVVSEKRQMDTVVCISPQKARDGKTGDHPAPFPVGLPEAYIEAMTSDGQSVYEPFTGSGSTLIACQKTGRRCFGMEIDPAYCDVILTRWAEYASADPIREDGVPWSSL